MIMCVSVFSFPSALPFHFSLSFFVSNTLPIIIPISLVFYLTLSPSFLSLTCFLLNLFLLHLFLYFLSWFLFLSCFPFLSFSSFLSFSFFLSPVFLSCISFYTKHAGFHRHKGLQYMLMVLFFFKYVTRSFTKILNFRPMLDFNQGFLNGNFTKICRKYLYCHINYCLRYEMYT